MTSDLVLVSGRYYTLDPVGEPYLPTKNMVDVTVLLPWYQILPIRKYSVKPPFVLKVTQIRFVATKVTVSRKVVTTTTVHRYPSQKLNPSNPSKSNL